MINQQRLSRLAMTRGPRRTSRWSESVSWLMDMKSLLMPWCPQYSHFISLHIFDDLNFGYLEGLRVADPVGTREALEIDIITGSDYYGSLVSGELIKGDDYEYKVSSALIRTSDRS